jgi:hypothetical protein
MKTTLRNKIKNTTRKSENKGYNGRCVTTSKICHEKKSFLIKMEGPIYFASERDFRVQPLL